MGVDVGRASNACSHRRCLQKCLNRTDINTLQEVHKPMTTGGGGGVILLPLRPPSFEIRLGVSPL